MPSQKMYMEWAKLGAVTGFIFALVIFGIQAAFSVVLGIENVFASLFLGEIVASVAIVGFAIFSAISFVVGRVIVELLKKPLKYSSMKNVGKIATVAILGLIGHLVLALFLSPVAMNISTLFTNVLILAGVGYFSAILAVRVAMPIKALKLKAPN